MVAVASYMPSGSSFAVQAALAKWPFRFSASSKTLFSNAAQGKTGWVRLVLRTPKLPRDYVSLMNVRLELIGRGIAYFDEFEFRKI